MSALAELAAKLFFKTFRAGVAFFGGNPVTAVTDGDVVISPTAANRMALVIEGRTGQSVNLVEIRKADGTVYHEFSGDSAGYALYSGANRHIVWNSTDGVMLASNVLFAWSATAGATATKDLGHGRAAAGVWEINNGTAGALRWLHTGGLKFRATTQSLDTTTLTADDTLSVTLQAGRKYGFKLVYYFVANSAADGFKMDFNGGSATATTFIAQARIDNGAAYDVLTNFRSTALNTEISDADTTATSFMIEVRGSIVVDQAGTFIPKWAKVADAGGALVSQIGSTLEVWDYP